VLCIDWRNATGEPASSRQKKSVESEFLEYYNNLKASVANPTPQPTSSNDMREMPLADNRQDLLEQVLQIDSNIQNYKRAGWLHYEHFGIALAKLKRMYFTACSHCKSKNPDMFEILSCLKCAKASNGNTFFKDLEQKIDYTPGYINYLIRIAALSAKYPKLKLTPWNFSLLSKYITYLPDQMEKDKHLWV